MVAAPHLNHSCLVSGSTSNMPKSGFSSWSVRSWKNSCGHKTAQFGQPPLPLHTHEIATEHTSANMSHRWMLCCSGDAWHSKQRRAAIVRPSGCATRDRCVTCLGNASLQTHTRLHCQQARPIRKAHSQKRVRHRNSMHQQARVHVQTFRYTAAP